MTNITEQIKKLQIEEKKLVEEIKKKFRLDKKTIYLPNLIPNKKTDYIFIAMEPSLKWAKNDVKEAEKWISSGFKNFIYSMEDFILRYSIQNYLKTTSYYITDISKAAMSVKLANENRKKIYHLWIDLLIEEIKIIANKNLKIIAIGNTAEYFINKYLKQELKNPVIFDKILHYSPQASKFRKEAPPEFKKSFDVNSFKSFINNFIDNMEMKKDLKDIIFKKLAKQEVTSNRMNLLFTYKEKLSIIKKQ